MRFEMSHGGAGHGPMPAECLQPGQDMLPRAMKYLLLALCVACAAGLPPMKACVVGPDPTPMSGLLPAHRADATGLRPWPSGGWLRQPGVAA